MKNQIQEFNMKLVQDNKDITIIDYVKDLNKEYFNIDIEFIDDFIDLVDKEGFIVNHEMLFKYDLLLKTSSTNVLHSLNSYELEDHVDYVLLKQQVDEGRTERNIFMLTTDAFKIICVRSLSFCDHPKIKRPFLV